MADTATRRMTLAEFLEWETHQERKHEFVRGAPRMMAGGTRAHNQIARNVLSRLAVRLEGKRCEPFGSDTKVITPAGQSRYPDVTVDCGPNIANAVAATEPTVLVEVLSESTMDIDQHEKLEDFQSIPTVRHILHLWRDRMQAELFTRDDSGWDRRLYRASEAVIELAAIGCSLTLAEAYAGVALEPDEQA